MKQIFAGIDFIPKKISDAVEVKPWLFKVRSLTNRHIWYDVIKRKDESYWCNCRSFKYNATECIHTDIIQAVTE